MLIFLNAVKQAFLMLCQQYKTYLILSSKSPSYQTSWFWLMLSFPSQTKAFPTQNRTPNPYIPGSGDSETRGNDELVSLDLHGTSSSAAY